MVATSSPLAVAAALGVLSGGGSALDAALAADAVLGVVQPMSTGLGGDLFALIESDGNVVGYNGSGAAPAALAARTDPMPVLGGETVTVPGHVEGWAMLHQRFGRLDLARDLAPAIALAAGGFPVGPATAAGWARMAPELRAGQSTGDIFLVGGRAPSAGERVANPAQARALEEVAIGGAPAFYEGWPGEAMVKAAQAAGSALSSDDLSSHRGDWVEPLAGRYREWEVLELPPNTQGPVALGIMAVRDGDPGDPVEAMSAAQVHRQVEAAKAAFLEASRCIGDPRSGGHSGGLCDPAWAAAVRAGLPQQASHPPPEALPGPGGTVYVAVADETMTVSLITSNYFPFGSAVAVPDGGFVLQNRGACFRAQAPEGHPNRLGPGRRPLHTIIPALVRRASGRWGALGVVGGPFQPQGQVQVVGHLASGLDPQAALDAPRWNWLGGTTVGLEAGLAHLRPELEARGHRVLTPEAAVYGGAQLVLAEDGFWMGGADGRQDSLAAGL